MKHLILIVSIVLSVSALSMSCSIEQEFETLVIAENEKVLELEPIEELDKASETETATEEKPYHYLFTEEAKAEIKRRIEHEYVTGPGFTNDFVTIKESVSTFLQLPDAFRPILGEEKHLPAKRQTMHQAAVYAWAMEDVELANEVSKEILQTVRLNSLHEISYFQKVNWTNEEAMWIQSSVIKKTMDSYYLIKDVEEILSIEEIKQIESWFTEYKNLGLNWFRSHITKYFGEDWENNGLKHFRNEGILPYYENSGTPFPIENNDGTPINNYTITWAQDNFNNRTLDTVALLYSWSIKNNDYNLELYCREFFKLIIKYGVFPDGTFWEIMRNESVYHNSYGVYYTNLSLTSLVYMAHLDAMTQHFPNDLLYDYETVEGIVHGSTNLTQEPYAGGSTTDGKTLKSLKTLILGQSKYLRTQEHGGWADTRFYNGESLNTTGKVQNSVIAALANLYYKDESLKDYYLYNVSKGFPAKKNIIGYGYYPEDYGGWGNLIAGGLWLEMEPYFFN